MEGFHLIRPEGALLLLPIACAAYWLYRAGYHRSIWASICDKHLLSGLLARDSGSNRLPIWLLILVIVIGMTSFMGISFRKLTLPTYKRTDAKVVVMDCSWSMLAQDLKPSRYAQALFKVRDMLQSINEGSVGMVAFTSEAFVVSPLTQDTQTIEEMVTELNPNMMPIQGANLSNALERASALIAQEGRTTGQIILVTSNTPKTSDMKKVRALKKKGMVTSVLAVGTRKGAPVQSPHGFIKDENNQVIIEKLQVEKLESLAKSGGGGFVHLSTAGADINRLLKDASDEYEQQDFAKSDQWEDMGHWFALAGIPFLLVLFRRGYFESLFG